MRLVKLLWLFGVLGGTAGVAGTDSAAARQFEGLPYFEVVGDRDSIPQNTVTTLAEDAQGQIWIGTQLGLVQFDGYRFQHFTHSPREPTSIAGNFVYSLAVDAAGKIWAGTRSDGVSVFEPDCKCFSRHFRHNNDDPGSLSDGTVRVIVHDRAGGTWVGTESGLDFLPPNSQNFRHHAVGNRITSLLLSRDNSLWVGTFAGLLRRAAGSDGLEQVSAGALTGQEITALYEADDGKLWVGTRTSGAFWLNPGERSWHRVEAAGAHPFVFTIAQPRKDEIWLGSFGGGITRVAARNGAVQQQLRHNPAQVGSLANDQVGALLLDRAGLLWVGIWGGGLQRYNPHPVAQVLRADPAGLSQSDIRSVLERQDGNLLLGTQGQGIDVLDRHGKRIGGYRPQPGVPGKLGDGTISAMVEASDGTLWVGLQQEGIFRLQPGSEEWQRFGVEQGLPIVRVHRLLMARDTLWVGTDAGIARWMPQEQRFQQLETVDGRRVEASVRAIAQDAAGRLWFGSGNAGLWLLEPDSNGLVSVRRDPLRADGLISDTINGLLVDRQGQLWVDTAQGLERLRDWDGQRARFDHVSALAGRPGLYLGGNLLEDQLGRIWTQWAVLDPQAMRIFDLGRADGLDIGTAWVGAYAQTRDSYLFYGGTQGLAVIDPTQFKPWDYAPPLIATELKINGLSAPLGALSPQLSLTPQQRNFSIEFAALDYSAPNRNRYAYRLLGLERDWIETDAEHRIASYGGLWPGQYTLEIRGSGRSGAWSPQPLRIAISVLPAWWQTVWFAGALVLGTGLLAWGGLHWRTARMGMEARALQALVDARTAEVVAQKQGIEQQKTDLEQAHATLAGLGEIGREITATLDETTICRTLHRHSRELLDATSFVIYQLDEAGAMLSSLLVIEHGEELPAFRIELGSDRPASRCARERTELLLDWAPGDLAPVPGTLDTLSALFAPMLIGERLLGVITVQSLKPHAYGESEQRILRSLCAYAAIALDNAAVYRRLQQTDVMLQRALAEQQLIFDSVAAGIFFVRDRVIRRCNRGTEELLGYGPGELLGQSTSVIFPDQTAFEEFGERNYPLIGAGRVAEGELEAIRKDGQRVWVSFLGRAVDPQDPDQGTVWVAQDISARKRNEAALERALREQEILFDNNMVGVMFTRDRTLVRCNRGFSIILGYDPDELTGLSTRLFFESDEAWARFGQDNLAALRAGEMAYGDVIYVRKDRERIWVAYHGKAIDPKDLSQGVLWAGIDITERKRNEAALLDANRELQAARDHLLETQQQLIQQEKMAALGTLTAGVAHEINNPTNFADGAVQNLQLEHRRLHDFLRHLAGDEAPAEILQAIAERFVQLEEMTATAREGHERIKRIVSDLRQFTRLDQADNKSVPIAEPIQSTVNLVRTRFDRIQFELDLTFNPSIECQPAKLGQVFMNLIINACEAIADSHDGRTGCVRIRTSAAAYGLLIEISDNGNGMDEATRQRVFEPFFTTKPVGAGTGLGLSIVFGIIRDHGGSIEVDSTPGLGTRFSVRLPLRQG